MKISDNEDTHVMLEMYSSVNIVVLYMEKDYVSHQLLKAHEEFSRMLELNNKSMGFLSSVQYVPPFDESQTFLSYNT